MRTRCLVMLLVASACNSVVAADWMPHFWTRSAPPTHSERLERAGQPFCTAPWASCGDSRHDWGYYVGGGAKKKGDGRYWHEGTWGYDHHLPPVKNPLGWYHGRRAQGGEGQYEPDEKNRPLRP
jgi:hypothetical protein